MFKKLFGPYPDEALLYSLDKIIGLYYKIDSKLKRSNASNNVPTNDATLIADPIEEKTTNVIDEPTTKKDVTQTDEKMNEIILETTTKNDVVPSPTGQPNESSSKKCTNADDTNWVSSRSSLKKSSSMQCNYVPSQLNVAENIFHLRRKVGSTKVDTLTKSSTKRYKRFNTKSTGYGDSLEVLVNDFESRMSIRDANGKKRIETISKKETKQRKVTSPHGLKWNLNGTERGSQTLNELTGRKHNMRLLKIGDQVQEANRQRKVVQTEWAVTRIYTFDDKSQTYEVMKKEMVLDESGSVKKIFAIAPNLTTIAYDPLKHTSKKLK